MSCPNCAGEVVELVAPYLGTHEIFRRMNLGRCAGCGIVYAYPQPTRSELARYYEHYWDGQVAVSTPSTRRYYLAQGVSRVRYIERSSPLHGPVRVLDMGAGLGLFHDAMLLLGKSHEYTAVETDLAQLAALRQRLGKTSAFGDLQEVAPGETADLIVLAHVLEHVARPHEIVSALTARLKPGGALLVEVPNGDHRYKANFESHLVFFDPESLRSLLAKHGEVLDVSTVGKHAAELRITQVHPERGLLRPLKEAVKSAIAAVTPRVIEKQIERYEMSHYGGDRQWLRALLRRPASSLSS